MIPAASDTTLSLDDDENSEFEGITSIRRIFTTAVQLIRIGIAIALLWGGSLFLAYTISLSDLILNAMVTYCLTLPLALSDRASRCLSLCLSLPVSRVVTL